MEDSIIYIVGALIFLAVKYFVSQSKNKTNTANKAPARTVQKRAAQPKQKQSIDDIFSDFVKELEKKQNPTSIQKKKVQPKPPVQKKQAVDWQSVAKTKIKSKEILIDHDAYHDISHRIDETHVGDAAAVVTRDAKIDFDATEVDWTQALITKEVFDRKF